MSVQHPRGMWKPVVEYELGCSSGHGVKLREGRAWCETCAVFVETPTRTGRTRRDQFVRGKFPLLEPFT